MAWFAHAALLTGLICGGAVLTIAESAAQQPRSRANVLYCRGGGQMTASIAHESDDAGRVTGSAILVRFVASRQPAFRKLPDIGQCTYFDRTMGQGESRVLMLRAPGASVDFTIQPNGAATRIEARGPRKLRDQINRLIEAVTDAEPFQVRIETRGTGPKRITSFER